MMNESKTKKYGLSLMLLAIVVSNSIDSVKMYGDIFIVIALLLCIIGQTLYVLFESEEEK